MSANAFPSPELWLADPASPACAEKEDEPPSSGPAVAGSLSYPPLRQAGRIVRFPAHHTQTISTAARAFKKRFFPAVPAKQWNDWRWQVSHRIRTPQEVAAMLTLSEAEKEALFSDAIKLPLGVTPYYMGLVSREDPQQPLRRTVIPTIDERMKSKGEADDPLCEEHQSPVPGLVHRYPDRALFLLSDFCSTYCRYCTRSRVVGRGGLLPSRSRFEKAFDYIASTPAIRDVLLSGGDPLLLSNERLDWILARLRQIPHVEIVRIGTKVPAVLPQRITPQLTRMLKRHHPLWMSLHFTHPDELTPETHRACTLLADAGIPLGSQTVLLKGINDSVPVMTDLVQGLMKMRVRPYYLYQCDPISGSAHFRTAISKGLEILKGLRGHTTGYAVPTFVVDAPGGGGKIPLMPEAMVGHEGSETLLCNYEERIFRYPDGPCDTAH